MCADSVCVLTVCACVCADSVFMVCVLAVCVCACVCLRISFVLGRITVVIYIIF